MNSTQIQVCLIRFGVEFGKFDSFYRSVMCDIYTNDYSVK